jgi:hypothetical protein
MRTKSFRNSKPGIIGPGRIEGNRAVAFVKGKRGALVLEPISCTDLDVANGGFLCVNATSGGNQSTPDYTVECELGYPVIRNIRFSGVRMKDVTAFVEVVKIAPEKPILGLSLLNITGTCQKGITLVNVRDAVLRGIHVTGFAGPLLAIANTTGSGLKGAVSYALPDPSK